MPFLDFIISYQSHKKHSKTPLYFHNPHTPKLLSSTEQVNVIVTCHHCYTAYNDVSYVNGRGISKGLKKIIKNHKACMKSCDQDPNKITPQPFLPFKLIHCRKRFLSYCEEKKATNNSPNTSFQLWPN